MSRGRGMPTDTCCSLTGQSLPLLTVHELVLTLTLRRQIQGAAPEGRGDDDRLRPAGHSPSVPRWHPSTAEQAQAKPSPLQVKTSLLKRIRGSE